MCGSKVPLCGLVCSIIYHKTRSGRIHTGLAEGVAITTKTSVFLLMCLEIWVIPPSLNYSSVTRALLWNMNLIFWVCV